MSERFTEILRAASEPAWSDAVRHRYVNELFAGAVPDGNGKTRAALTPHAQHPARIVQAARAHIGLRQREHQVELCAD